MWGNSGTAETEIEKEEKGGVEGAELGGRQMLAFKEADRLKRNLFFCLWSADPTEV